MRRLKSDTFKLTPEQRKMVEHNYNTINYNIFLANLSGKPTFEYSKQAHAQFRVFKRYLRNGGKSVRYNKDTKLYEPLIGGAR